MLTLTDHATTIVKDIAAQPEMPEGAALRITADPDVPDRPDQEPAFAVSAGHPEPGDQVVEQQGATIYLDEASARLLDDMVLDAAVDETGRVEFALGLQQHLG